MRNVVHALLVVAFLMAGMTTPTASAENRALLVGVSHYQQISKVLDGPQNDVADMQGFVQQFLAFQPGQIKTLVDADATHDNILEGIQEWLITGTKAGDRVLFYFSGHGTQIKDTGEDEDDHLDEALAPVDVRLEGHEFVNLVTDDDLQHLFDQITDRDVMVISDSCHSGTVTRGLGRRSTLVKGISPSDMLPKPNTRSITVKDLSVDPVYQAHRLEVPLIAGAMGRTVWTAASAAQLAFVDDREERRNSVFTRALIRGITSNEADADHSGNITNNELLGYTQRASADFCVQRSECKDGKGGTEEQVLGLTPTLEIQPERRASSFAVQSALVPPMAVSTPMFTDFLPEHEANDITLSVESSNKGNAQQVKRGDKMFVQVRSKRGGYLYLFDHDSRSGMRKLFPAYGEDNRISANKAVFIPDVTKDTFEIQATTAGASELLAIVTHEPLKDQQLDTVANQSKDMEMVEKPMNYIGQIAGQVTGTYTGDIANRLRDYASKRYAYNVED